MKNTFLILVLLLELFENGSAIMCYECNSALNSFCNDKVPPDNLKRNCSELDEGVKHILCRKIVQHIDYGVNGQLPNGRVIRSCGWDDSRYKDACYHRSGYGGRQEVCSCTTDYCNGSPDNIASTTALMASFVFILLQKHVLQ